MERDSDQQAQARWDMDTAADVTVGDTARARHPQRPLLTRRAVLARAGLGAAALPLAGWLAACGQAASTTRGGSPTSTALTPTPTPDPTATPDTRPLTLVITGDLMLGRSVNQQILASSTAFPFTYTADYLHGFDLTVGNLECVVSTLGQPVPDKPYTFRGDPKGFARLATTGFDVLSVANNHSGDFGKAAFTDMLAHLPQYGITPLGGGRTLAEARQPVIKTVRETTVGFLAYCEIDPFSFAATTTTAGHAWLDPAAMRADILALRPRVDFLIVFTHWGIEYQPQETGHQQAMARLAIDAGADFVVGAHPHVVQPYEIYQGKPIVYSLGNFVFDEMFSADVRRGNVVALTVRKSRLLDWKLRPSFIVGDYGQPQWG
ncbi:MAG: CapA family protein [Ktedonobacterales bacterium]|nr:CapA family protein [Ktedonobacterales bacterium]